jgi:hypothetical protein
MKHKRLNTTASQYVNQVDHLPRELWPGPKDPESPLLMYSTRVGLDMEFRSFVKRSSAMVTSFE